MVWSRRPLRLAAFIFLVTGCTSVGLPDTVHRRRIDFGPAETLALCLYIDEGISETEARDVIDDAWRNDASVYRLAVTVAKVVRWPRPAFTVHGIIEALRVVPLEPGCDRILALIGRHVGDFIWGLVGLPEALGAVEEATLTHGYAVVRRASLNQLFISPGAATRHEIYHLLGCDAHFDMRRCYEQIARLKRWKREEQSGFFPAWDPTNKQILGSREAVNARLKKGLDSDVSASPRPTFRTSQGAFADHAISGDVPVPVEFEN